MIGEQTSSPWGSRKGQRAGNGFGAIVQVPGCVSSKKQMIGEQTSSPWGSRKGQRAGNGFGAIVQVPADLAPGGRGKS